MKIRMSDFNEFLEVADTHRPAFLETYVMSSYSRTIYASITAFSKYGMPVKVVLSEKCKRGTQRECLEIMYMKVKEKLEAYFPAVYNGEIGDE